MIALVGGDATGKSTLISGLEKWLGAVFVTRRVHVGKPPSTWLTAPLNLFRLVARRLLPRLRSGGQCVRRGSSGRTGPRFERDRSRSVLQAVRAAALAWDRHRLLAKVRRRAAAGEIVLCDRYTSTSVGAMDSPRLGELSRVGRLKTRLIRWLARVEHRLYERNPAADLVVKLTVPIEIAKQRNRLRQKSDKHPEIELVRRHQSLSRMQWDDPRTGHVIEVDTAGNIENTMAAVRRSVWQSL